MADDSRIGEEPRDLAITKARHLVDVETSEAAPEILALAQNGQPGKSGLETLKTNLLEEAVVVGDRTAPFMVMIGLIFRDTAMPPAARLAVRSDRNAVFYIVTRILAVAGVVGALSVPASAQDEADMAVLNGFMKTVFGVEYHANTAAANRVKKYTKPVRVYIDNRSKIDRRKAAAAFVDSLRSRIGGLDIRRVSSPNAANYIIHIVDNNEYHSFTRALVGGSAAGLAGSQCLARLVTGPGTAIQRSDAVVVSDLGEGLFKRCLIEETLQGLGPANDNAGLGESVFNDYSAITRFTTFDRTIMNMLYHPRIRAGMTPDQVRPLLPGVLADVKRRLR